jgi:ABC-2 type transport system ATP-binding protein
MSVSVKNISKKYGEQLVLDKVTMEINRGEIAGLIGPNGAGKSTLMRIITGYLAPTSGEVLVNGLDVALYSHKIRGIIGYLPEHNPLYPDMFICEYLLYVAGLYRIKQNTRDRVHTIIHQTGLEPEIGKKIGALSKGYRQRVGLAQALLHEPEVLILDEPTAGLDPNQIVDIRNLIRDLGRDRTIILSTHIMQEVEAICTRVIIISKGSVVADDPSVALKTSPGISSQTIIVEFDQPVRTEQLKSLKDVHEALNTSANCWLIQARADKDIRADIFEFAVREGLKVLSLQRQQKTLEEVFRSLTR